jgi:hypothetical protein
MLLMNAWDRKFKQALTGSHLNYCDPWIVYAPSQAGFSVAMYMTTCIVTQLHTVPLVLFLFKFKQPTHFVAENELAKTSYHDFPNKHNIMIHNPVI